VVELRLCRQQQQQSCRLPPRHVGEVEVEAVQLVDHSLVVERQQRLEYVVVRMAVVLWTEEQRLVFELVECEVNL